VAIDYFLADGQTDASAGILVSRLQALKNDEDAIGELRIYTNAIIPDRE